MDKRDLEALKNWLDRTGNLPRYQEDLIDDAALKTMARKLPQRKQFRGGKGRRAAAVRMRRSSTGRSPRAKVCGENGSGKIIE